MGKIRNLISYCSSFGVPFFRITIMQNCVFTGISYSSPTLGSAMSNLIPAFTFILAIIFRFLSLSLSLSKLKKRKRKLNDISLYFLVSSRSCGKEMFGFGCLTQKKSHPYGFIILLQERGNEDLLMLMNYSTSK